LLDRVLGLEPKPSYPSRSEETLVGEVVYGIVVDIELFCADGYLLGVIFNTYDARQ